MEQNWTQVCLIKLLKCRYTLPKVTAPLCMYVLLLLIGHLELYKNIFTVLTLGRTRKFIPPPCYKGRGEVWMKPLPKVFDMLQHFETILPSLESLWSSLQDEVYFMGCGAAGGLWRHQQWSSPWILPRIRNQVKTSRNAHFCVWHEWYHINKYFAWF